ncbi:LysM peptidoglycan-binding domain-containing protein [Phycicoccus sp. CSK15P-2]|uniref:LysM peptidoglycan-binding domain-containing protein n=1 Tax=Phycicoccus sp. CSK15P-2 TaxID=2807627 RepID=UPI001EF27AD4|nr:LysM peptidoglycan-binding domain-containing protein [Phycicoccus sp. CSK15P-2]
MSAIAWEPTTGYPAPAPRRPRLTVVPDPAVSAPARPALRLTARGRVVLLVLAALLVAGVVGVRGTGGAGAAEAERVVTVSAGETLSEIAATEMPGLTVTEGVLAIQLANGLNTAQISTGQELVIPRG